MIGQSIAHYKITAKLGQGGMGAVCRVTDTKLDRDVAFKVLPKDFASDADRLRRTASGRKAKLHIRSTHYGESTILKAIRLCRDSFW